MSHFSSESELPSYEVGTSMANGAIPPIKSAGRDYVAMLSAAMDVASARMPLLIVTLGGSAMWGYTIYDPAPWRVYAAAAHSVVFLWPLIVLYLKRG